VGGCEICVGGILALDRCPRDYAGAESFELLYVAEQAQRGCWPFSVGLLEHPAKAVSLIQAAQSELADGRAANG